MGCQGSSFVQGLIYALLTSHWLVLKSQPQQHPHNLSFKVHVYFPALCVHPGVRALCSQDFTWLRVWLRNWFLFTFAIFRGTSPLHSSPIAPSVPNCLATPKASMGHHFIQCGTVDISRSILKLKWQGKQAEFRHIDDAGLRTILDKMRILRQLSFSSHLSLPRSFLCLSHLESLYVRILKI